jgi:hypothetical protein
MCAKGMRLTRREFVAGTFAALATTAVRAQSAVPESPRRQSLEIAGGAAPQALREFVRQTGLQVLFEFDAVRHHTVQRVSGHFEASEALSVMLAGSGLGYEFINDRTVSVRPTPVVKTTEVSGR